MFAVLIQALIAGLIALLPRILAGIGVFWISDTVSKPIFAWLQSQMMAQFGGLPADALNMVKLLGVFDSVVIIFSAYAMVLSIKAGKAAFVAR